MIEYGSLDERALTKPSKQISRSSTNSTSIYASSGDEDETEPFVVGVPAKAPKRSHLFRGLIIIAMTITLLRALPREQNMNQSEHFDYIVVGAGPAGIICAVSLARRLESEGSPSKVLLLESGEASQKSVLQSLDNTDQRNRNSGEDKNNERVISIEEITSVNIKAVDESSANDTVLSIDINDFDVPHFWNKLSAKRDRSGNNSTYLFHHWPMDGNAIVGRAVGGSGIHNAMINVRALKSDFHRWNMSKWNPSEMMTYYKALESYDIASQDVSLWNKFPTDRGENGPLMTVPAGQSVDPVASSFIQASLASGVPLASLGFNDLNETKRIGAGFYEFNIRDGVRDSVASAFLTKNLPQNLEIRKGSTVLNVVFDSIDHLPMQRSAIGVQYISTNDGLLKKAYLRPNSKGKRQPEIILSGGAIMTPQILANSGIREGGDIVDLPGVGKNLQDHPAIAVAFPVESILLKELSSYEYSTFDDYLKFEEKRKGKLGNHRAPEDPNNSGRFGTAGFSAGAFLKSPWSLQSPDIQLTVFPKRLEPHFTASTQVAPGSKSLNEMLVTVALLNAEGRYDLQFDSLSSSDVNIDPAVPLFQRVKVPRIIPTGDAYLTEHDIDRLAWGLEEVRRIQKFSPLRENTKGEFYPGSSIKGQKLRDFIEANMMTNAHWCGSTRMGNESDEMTVVDQNLRVKGVNSLRVVDAGVMPSIPNGNTHSTTCAVAMHAVDLILGK